VNKMIGLLGNKNGWTRMKPKVPPQRDHNVKMKTFLLFARKRTFLSILKKNSELSFAEDF